MKIKNLLKDKTIVQQVNSIKSKYPNFTVTFDAISFRAEGSLQPTSRSEVYTVEINYKINTLPEIKILNPILVKNDKNEDIPHMYNQKKLCLFMPKYIEFKYGDLISETIIPWTSLWLYYYEVWHSTNKWLGGGIHN